MSDYVYLKNLNGQQIKPVTDLAAINMTTTNGIGVSTVNGGTIGIIDGYIESAYYTEMADPAVGAANVSSAYVDGGTAVAILGAYTVASAVDTAAPSQQKVPSEKAVVDALNNVVVSGVSYYAGTGIDINAGHTVSVANVPQSSVAGLETTLTGINTAVAAKQDAISAGYRMSLDGTTLNQERYFNIESPTSATITLQAGHAYKITATNSSKTLDSEQIPANQFGLEGHAEIFVAGTGLIKTTSNVVLAQALEPDAVNNCTVRFHDGKAIISVEDHVAGYIVVSASGATAGTLPYALSTASNEYISFDASLNNMTLDLAGATTYAGEKHVVGNGYTETILSGGINCTSKTTFSNLSMDGVINSGGTMTLGDVNIPSGSTVSVSGGGLAIEKVVGDGTIGSIVQNINHSIGSASGVTFTGASGSRGIVVSNGASIELDGCTLKENDFNGGGAALYCEMGSAVTLRNSLITSNHAKWGAVQIRRAMATGKLINCTFSANSHYTGTDISLSDDVYIVGSTITANGNTFCGKSYLTDTAGQDGHLILAGRNNYYSGGCVSAGGVHGHVQIESGAIIDLTGNTNATPLALGGGITIPAQAIVTIIDSAGTSHNFSELAITGSSITKLGEIYGATVSILPNQAGGPWVISTTVGESTVSATNEAQELVIDGGLVTVFGL